MLIVSLLLNGYCVWEYCCFIKDGSYLNVLYDKGMVILFFEW